LSKAAEGRFRPRGQPAAQARSAGGVQRGALGGASRRAVAVSAQRPAAMVRGLSTDAALAASRCWSRMYARCCCASGAGARASRRRQPHLTVHTGVRRSSRLRILDISEGGSHVDGVSADMGCHGRETDLTRYRIYRNSTVETTYISAHEGNKPRDPKEFPNLDIALAVLRQCGIPEYEIRRVTKELGAINGAIVQLPEPIVFS
jgi:hypothetical protein